jgi:hypothetical protein
MKALTVKQPWASLIAAGIKDVENRSWPTRYRGPLLIHAGAAFDISAKRVVNEFQGHYVPPRDDLFRDPMPRAGIIARIELVDCIRNSGSEWAEPGEWHWILSNAQIVEFEPCRGKLGLWNHGPEFPAAQMSLAFA